MRAMKHSGIPWIGEIPAGWRIERIKTIFTERTELSELGNEELLSVSEYYGVDKRASRVDDNETLFRSESLVGYKKCYKGDFVSNIMLAWKGSFGITEYDGVVSPAYCVYKPSDNIFPKYYHYLFRTSMYTGQFRCYSKGIIDSRLRLYSPYFYNVSAIIPPIEEQQRIADFLDQKCGEVDEMVALQEQIIEELKAYKQAVITEATTHGLNPNATMKPSGIDWIGEIPEGWEIIKVGYIFYILDYLREPISAEQRERNNPQYDYYGASGVIDKIDHYNVDDKVLLIGEDGANLVMRNLPLIYKAEGKFWVNNHAHILKPIKDNYNYLAHVLEAADYRDYITGSAQPKLSQENLRAVKLPVPPISEQQQIAEYLDKKCSEIDAMVAIKQEKIEELKEYKKSIIYEYITGKKEVV